MNLLSYNNKFSVFKSFRGKLPGVDLAFNFLNEFNMILESSLSSDLHTSAIAIKIEYYDFEYQKIGYYDLVKFNNQLHDLYKNTVVNDRVLFNNILYQKMCQIYDVVYNNYNYKYNEKMFNKFSIINKIIHGFRLSATRIPLKFFVQKVLNTCSIQFFENVSAEDSYMFLFEYILYLSDFGVLKYEKIDHSITFNSAYGEDLIKLAYCSFDLMILGNNEVYDALDLSYDNVERNVGRIVGKYETFTEPKKLLVNDLLFSLVLSSTTNVICASSDINNIFVETSRNAIK